MPARAPTEVLKSCLLSNGIKSVSIRKRDAQTELTNLVDEATTLAKRVDRVPGRDVDRSEFVRELSHHHRLGQVLPLAHFEQLFTAVVLARYRYRSDSSHLPKLDEDPATRGHLAGAVDAFEKAAWFWETVEAFFEDDHPRADEAERGASSSEAEDGADQGFVAGSSSVGESADAGAAASTSVAAANHSAVATLAAGVGAMDLDDDVEVVDSEMEVDD
ncbi:hypothetical protein N657DRAFT_631933 [Parathielavia appendiculata]|uniref:Uncharacterized protein n=1 Tax=Parathielavia appendiculata TaxID=2587402 RepID=A0AAN6U4A1_9PEZI|nr:hypothetical protein N657DRAFT_631933 [Parathielavia appendiculata]